MKTRVINRHRELQRRGDVYIGRGSRLGNKHRIGIDGTREEVIARWKIDFDNRLRKDREFRRYVKSLKGKRLV